MSDLAVAAVYCSNSHNAVAVAAVYCSNRQISNFDNVSKRLISPIVALFVIRFLELLPLLLLLL